MKKLSVVLMALALTVGAYSAPCVILAQDNEVMVANEVSGTVTSVDPQAQKLVVTSSSDEGQKETALSTNDSSMIEKDGKAATLADVATEDEITVSYKVDDNGQNVVSSLSASSQQ